ncbi:MAG: transposase [Kineosporiaceae bacterium]
MRAQHRLSKLLLRHGIVYSGGNAWTGEHDRWLRRQQLDLPAELAGTRTAFVEAYDAVLTLTARRDRLDRQIAETAASPRWQPIVSRLSAIRGIADPTGLGLAVEIGDWERFTGAEHRAYGWPGAPVNRPPGRAALEDRSTKTGNSHARRLLVEAAWHHGRPLRSPGKVLTARRNRLSPGSTARGEAADRRLRHRWVTMSARNKRSPII